MADRHHVLNSWLEVFSPTVMGCVSRDGVFDFVKWEEWCRASANAGANGIRILPYAPWAYPSGAVPIETLYCPYRFDPVQRAWNLDLWNENYFLTLKRMVEIAYKYGLRLWFALFDNCQWHHGAGAVTPWGNNVQGINGYYASLPYALRWVDRVHATLGKSINYEIINEGEARQLSLTKAAEWIVAVFDRLIFKGIPAEQICWGPLPSSIYKDGKWEQDREHDLAQHILSITERRDRTQSNKVYRAMHGVGVANEPVGGVSFPASYCGEWAIQWWANAHSGKGFLSDDGVSNGSNALDKLPNGKYTRPSAAEWYKVAVRLFKTFTQAGELVVERLPQNLNPVVWLPALEAIADAYKVVHGKELANRGKYPPPKPEPVPEPHKPPVIPENPADRIRFWLGAGSLVLLGIIVLIAIVG